MKQTDSCKWGVMRWGLIERRGRDQSKNTHKGTVDMDQGKGTDYGSGRAGWVDEG